MQIWFTHSDRTKVTWGTDVVGGVAQLDILMLERPDDGSWESKFVFADQDERVGAGRLAWAQSVESADPVPPPVVPSSPEEAGGSDGAFKGAWSAEATYIAGDTVTHAESTWGATTAPAVGDEPGVAGAWAELAASGGGGVSIPTFTAAHAAGAGTLAWYNDSADTVTITGLRVTLSAAAVDAATVVDVNVDGTTALAAPVSVAVGQTTSGKTVDEIVVPVGSALTVDVDSVGTPGADETVLVQFYV